MSVENKKNSVEKSKYTLICIVNCHTPHRRKSSNKAPVKSFSILITNYASGLFSLSMKFSLQSSWQSDFHYSTPIF